MYSWHDPRITNSASFLQWDLAQQGLHLEGWDPPTPPPWLRAPPVPDEQFPVQKPLRRRLSPSLVFFWGLATFIVICVTVKE